MPKLQFATVGRVVARLRCCAATARQPSPFGLRSSAPSACRAEAQVSVARTGAKAGGGGRNSNLRRLSQRIYSPPPLPLGTLLHGTFARGSAASPEGVAGRSYGEGVPGCQLEKRRRLCKVAGKRAISGRYRRRSRSVCPCPAIVRHPVPKRRARIEMAKRPGPAGRSGGTAKGGRGAVSRQVASTVRGPRLGLAAGESRESSPPGRKPAEARPRRDRMPRSPAGRPRRLPQPPSPPAGRRGADQAHGPAAALRRAQRGGGVGESRPQGARAVPDRGRGGAAR